LGLFFLLVSSVCLAGGGIETGGDSNGSVMYDDLILIPSEINANYLDGNLQLKKAWTRFLFDTYDGEQACFEFNCVSQNVLNKKTGKRVNIKFKHKLQNDISFKLGVALPWSIKRVGKKLFSLRGGRYDNDPSKNINFSIFKVTPKN